MSQLLEARARLQSALETAGVRTATTGRLSAPCVLIEPGDPWTEPVGLPRRLSRWRLTALGGKADSEGSFAALADLIDGCDIGLRTIDGVSLPTWQRPADYGMPDGLTYAGSIATVQVPTA